MPTLHSIHDYDIAPGAMCTTVRHGGKWYEEPDPNIDLCRCTPVFEDDGDELKVKFTDHSVVGKGRIMTRQFLQFKRLTDAMLVNEHEESSRTVKGLLESMRRAYGPDFNEDAFVTVLNYWRTA